VCCVLALVALGGCGDDEGEGCVFDPVSTATECDNIATDLGCNTFSFNPDTDTCHTIDCPTCDLDDRL
jgi:hypothetical protein